MTFETKKNLLHEHLSFDCSWLRHLLPVLTIRILILCVAHSEYKYISVKTGPEFDEHCQLQIEDAFIRMIPPSEQYPIMHWQRSPLSLNVTKPSDQSIYIYMGIIVVPCIQCISKKRGWKNIFNSKDYPRYNWTFQSLFNGTWSTNSKGKKTLPTYLYSTWGCSGFMGNLVVWNMGSQSLTTGPSFVYGINSLRFVL